MAVSLHGDGAGLAGGGGEKLPEVDEGREERGPAGEVVRHAVVLPSLQEPRAFEKLLRARWRRQ
eukprot:4409782-Pyramimonas_sp.AAC.2